jgi:hypothetical protein
MMEVFAEAASEDAGRTASVEPACLASLGATSCDYLRLRVLTSAAGDDALSKSPTPEAAASTLVKLSVASTGAGPQSTPPRVWLSGVVLAELGVGVGAVLGAELVHASAVRPWPALRVSPVAAATPSGITEPRAVWPPPFALPTATEVRISLGIGIGAPLRYHPWHPHCRCRETLVRNGTRVSVAARLARQPLHAVAMGVGGEDGVAGGSVADGGSGVGARGGVGGADLAADGSLSQATTGVRGSPEEATGAAAGASPLAAEWGTIGPHTPVHFVAPHPPPQDFSPLPTDSHSQLHLFPSPPPPLGPPIPTAPPGPMPSPAPPAVNPLLLVLLGLLRRSSGGDGDDSIWGATGGRDSIDSTQRAASAEMQRGSLVGVSGAGSAAVAARAAEAAQVAAGGGATAAGLKAELATALARPADTDGWHPLARPADTAGWHRLARLFGGGGLTAELSPVLLTGARGVGKAEAVASLCARHGVVLLELSPHQIAREYGEGVDAAVDAAVEAARR